LDQLFFCLLPQTAFFFEIRTKQKARQKRNPSRGDFCKSHQKPTLVFLIPVKGKLAKMSCVKYDLLKELSPVGFFHPAKVRE